MIIPPSQGKSIFSSLFWFLLAGADVSIVTFSKMVGTALEAAEVLAAQGISAEVMVDTKSFAFFFSFITSAVCVCKSCLWGESSLLQGHYCCRRANPSSPPQATAVSPCFNLRGVHNTLTLSFL